MELEPEVDPELEVLARVEKGRVGPYSARILAQQILAELREHDPQILDAWLGLQAENMLWSLITQMDRRDRGNARRTSARSVFAAVANSPTSARRQAVRCPSMAISWATPGRSLNSAERMSHSLPPMLLLKALSASHKT